jgi:hypothetical protein
MTVQTGAKRWSISLVAAALCGCSASVPIEAEFPKPLIQPLTLRVGILLDEALSSFQHDEQLPYSSNWSIQMGAAHIAMFNPLFASMFTHTESVTTLPVAATEHPSLDVVIKPVVDKFEFDVPQGSDSKFVEVWVRYHLQVYQPDGTLVMEWPVVGYGKAQTGRMGNEGSLHRAAVRALREVGANVATEFATQPELSPWLEEPGNDVQISAEQSPLG